jgi:hypothetical protein
MVKTINLTANVPPDRELHIVLPEDVPPGPVEIVITVTSPTASTRPTLGDLLDSELFGIWREREDIDDSAEFARRLREKAWSRYGVRAFASTLYLQSQAL